WDRRCDCGGVGVVSEPLYGRRYAALAALEIDDAIAALMPAAAMPHRHAALIVAAAGLDQAFGQRLDRLALPQIGAVNEHELTLGGRWVLEGFEGHDALDPRGHVDLVAFGESDDRFLDVLLLAAHAAKRLGLALAQVSVDGQHLNLD